ncbi:hypothetical protein TTHERM_001517361 (macronuclear) [Tetrahymena thermophila SB210]|uniref:Uncharacterized protein n=1 Tax=Tetrahymena thermophila (strain SB210) TaxID=312017 RepID=W7XEI5_TETTS|nr:hypothetical protein TTHERM_001517361 [Tetrahymena thermophila SB210]EWS75093.1 hypothetical protein TTHERM_001517361 [Tetrahymena thermophila SB210]|eukprot:XP_012652373.1 hypothetical protein TTHERM_001517361 [Tetrahymena thermophila SB210]
MQIQNFASFLCLNGIFTIESYTQSIDIASIVIYQKSIGNKLMKQLNIVAKRVASLNSQVLQKKSNVIVVHIVNNKPKYEVTNKITGFLQHQLPLYQVKNPYQPQLEIPELISRLGMDSNHIQIKNNHDFNLKYFAKVINIRYKKQVPVEYSDIQPKVFIFGSFQESRIQDEKTYPNICTMQIKINKQKKFV